MAVTRDNNDNTTITSRRVSKQLDLIDQKMDSLYSDIYITRPDNKNNLKQLEDELLDSIDSLDVINPNNVSGMSELLRRIQYRNSPSNKNVKELEDNVSTLLSDTGLITTLFANESIHNYISSQNYIYNSICKYVPKLQDALDLKCDNVLCSDNFDKKFINVVSNYASDINTQIFNTNVNRIEDEYDMSNFLEKTYKNTSKYGEDFIYVIPYNRAFKDIFKRRARMDNQNMSAAAFSSYYESTTMVNLLKEGYTESKEYKEYIDSVTETYSIDLNEFDDSFKGFEVNVYFNNNRYIPGPVNEYVIYKDLNNKYTTESMSHMFESALNESADRSKKIKFDNIGSLSKTTSKLSTDGFINLDTDYSKIDNDFNGCVLERLPRENVFPVDIGTHGNHKILGYCYFDFQEDKTACGYCGGHHNTIGIGNSAQYSHQMTEDQIDLGMRYIAAQLSATIDYHFINANKDLKEEIYSILRYNESFDINRRNNIAVTFIPADDIIHTYFELDEFGRGISDLANSIVPAMLYMALYLTYIIGYITRSSDKRIYYVKQNVEKNVARTMMNTVQQIKKGNMGIRQIESMNNILNVIGKYNDFIIPTSQNGDAPIQFEVMNGQDIENPSDMLEKMEEAAVNATHTPIEMVNSALQQDFATRFTMSNTRYLKMIYSVQNKTEKFFSKIYTKVYNYECNTNFPKIEIQLPPPTYLTMTNLSQIIDNWDQNVQKIIDTEMIEETDEVKNEFKRLYIRDGLNSYLNYNKIKKLIDIAKTNVEANKNPAVASSDQDQDMNEY